MDSFWNARMGKCRATEIEKHLPGRRNLWVTDTFEWLPEAQLSQPANPMPDMRGFRFPCSQPAAS